MARKSFASCTALVAVMAAANGARAAQAADGDRLCSRWSTLIRRGCASVPYASRTRRQRHAR
jgi:hypothetical protein